MIGFTLTESQKEMQGLARDFAQNVVKDQIDDAYAQSDPQAAFERVKPAYETAGAMGLPFAHLPEKYGGMGASLLDVLIATEEICAVDPGFAANLGVNGLATMPILLYGSDSQKEKWLTAATEGDDDYITGYVVSEGKSKDDTAGTANFDHPDAHPAGMGLTAKYDEQNGEYILNGRKYWPGNAGGWDETGADMNLFLVRTDPESGGTEGLSALIVPKNVDGISYMSVDKMGQRTHQTVEIICDNARVPEENLLAEGDGDLVINKVFGWSGALVGITAVGTARSAYEYTLDWARDYTAGGSDPIFSHQAVGYELFDIAMELEAARTMCWRAASYIDEHGLNAGGILLGAMAKVYATETCFDHSSLANPRTA